MFYDVLVLLDGSEVSEVILQYVPSFVRSAGVKRLTFLRVVEDSVAQDNGAAQSYLEERVAQLKATWDPGLLPLPDIDVAAVTSTQSNVSDVVTDFAKEADADAIMLTTRGWSGADWWTTGSVAQRIIRDSNVPVFAARLRGGRHSRPGIINRVMVPLDGSLLAEQALPYAEHLAKTASAALNLLYVDEATGRSGPAKPSEAVYLEMDFTSYLTAMSERLKASVSEVITTVRHGPAGQQISEMAQDGSFDLIAMSTHGRTGPGRGAFGGVTERVLHGCRVPVLVVPPRVKAPKI